MKNINPQPPLAWSSKFWIQLQREFTQPNVKDGLLEADYIFRAILKNKNNVVRLTNGGSAYWDNISTTELSKWRTTMTLWGWGAKKIIPWNEAIEPELLKSSIRLFALHPEGPLPSVMCKGAEKRKEWLLQVIDKANKNPLWSQGPLRDADVHQRFSYLQTLDLDKRLQFGKDFNNFFEAYTELLWKKKASIRVYGWLLRKGTLPLSTVTQWLHIWAWEEGPTST